MLTRCFLPHSFNLTEASPFNLPDNNNSGYEGTFHNRPNGKELECSGENLTYKIEVDSDVISIYLAEEALDSWLNSMGHRYTLEDSASNTVLAQFTAWIPKYECWGTFWVQNFY